MASSSKASLARMLHIVTLETTESDSSLNSKSVKLVTVVSHEIAFAGLFPNLSEDYFFMNKWKEPFDYKILPCFVSLELIGRCPFLVGSNRASYLVAITCAMVICIHQGGGRSIQS